MKKIITIVLILMVVVNVALVISSLDKKTEEKKEAGFSKSAKIELKGFNPLFFVSVLKF